MSQILDEFVEGLEPSPEMLSVMAGQKMPALLALDIGTSGVRAALFDESGRELEGASVRIDHRSHFLNEFATVEAQALLGQVERTLDSLFANSYLATIRTELIAISCFWHSLIGVDEAGEATTPVLGWADRSAAAAAYQLRSELDEARVHARTGCRLHPSYWPAKLRKLRTDEPEVFRRTARWLSFAEFLMLHFFGEATASVSTASGTGLMNQRTCEWDEELLETLGVSVSSLPEIAVPHQTLPRLTSVYAARWPQLSEARLFPAVGDGAANNIGAGCLTNERLALMIGTSGAMRVCFTGEPPERLPSELWCYRVDRKRIVIGGALSDGGGLHHWLRETLLPEEDAATLESELELFSPDAHGLTILPFWSGERSTGWTPDARGAILGLTSKTSSIEILRAAMEAIAYRFALIAQALEPLAPAATLVATGHALRSSPTWVQILADVLGRRVLLSGSSRGFHARRGLACARSGGQNTEPRRIFRTKRLPRRNRCGAKHVASCRVSAGACATS